MESPETNTPSHEQDNGPNSPQQLALNGLRLQYGGFVDDDQLRLAGLLDRHNALDHSMSVIKLDAEVKLSNRRPSPLSSNYGTERTTEELDEIANRERQLSKAEYEALEGREVQDWEVKRFNEIRQRQTTIRQTIDQAAGKDDYDEAVAEIAGLQKKHHTTHRPTTPLEKSASDRHAGLLDGSYVRKDRLTQAQAHFEDSHGDEAHLDPSELHPDQAKNLRKQRRAFARASKGKNFAESEVERSLRGEGPEQFRIRMKQERIAKRIAKLSQKVRNKGLWIDDLFELHPEAPAVPEEPTAAQPNIEKYHGRPYEAMSAQEFTVAKDVLEEKQSRTERAMNTILNELSKPSGTSDEKAFDLEHITQLLEESGVGTPAIAKFTFLRLQREGILNSSGKVVLEQQDIKDLVSKNQADTMNTRPVEATKAKEATRARLENVKVPSDRVYAFALGHIGGFYSKKNDYEQLPRLSRESLTSALSRVLEDEATDENISKAYTRLIEQGILSPDGTVIQSRETIRGALGALYGDDTPDGKEDKKKKQQRNQRRPRQ